MLLGRLEYLTGEGRQSAESSWVRVGKEGGHLQAAAGTAELWAVLTQL